MVRPTWILIANASQARLFKSEKPYHEIELIKEFNHPESRAKTSDLVTDNNGRILNRGRSSPSSVYQEPTSPKEVEMERFAHELAEQLNSGRTSNQFSGLVLIAPSQFHGLLSKFCNNHVRNLIIRTIDKDYTKFKERDLKKMLDSKIRFYPQAA